MLTGQITSLVYVGKLWIFIHVLFGISIAIKSDIIKENFIWRKQSIRGTSHRELPVKNAFKWLENQEKIIM